MRLGLALAGLAGCVDTAAPPGVTSVDPGFTATVVVPESHEPVVEGDSADLIWSGAQGFGHMWYGMLVTGSTGTVEIDAHVTRMSDDVELTPPESKGYFLLVPSEEPGAYVQEAGQAYLLLSRDTFVALDGQDLLFEADVSDLNTGDAASTSIELTAAVTVE